MEAKFSFNEIDSVTNQLKETSDMILCYSYTDNYIFFGTVKGAIHIIEIDNNEGMQFGPYNQPIKDIFSQNDSFAYVSQSKVALLNKKTCKESFSLSSNSFEKVLIWSNYLGNLSLVCASATTLSIIQKGWVNTNVKQLKCSFEYIQSIKINGNLVCVLDSKEAKILNLTTEEVLFTAKLDNGQGHFHWMTSESLLFSTGLELDILKYKLNEKNNKDSIMQSEKVMLAVVPYSISSIRNKYIIFNSDDKVYMLGDKREILTSQKLFGYGKLVSSNRIESRFLFLTSHKIFIVNMPNIKEHILNLIKEFKLDQAKILIDKFNITALTELQPFIDELVKRNQFDDAATFINKSEINPSQEYFRDLISTFAENYKLHLIISHLPYIENQFLNSLIIHSLISHPELLLDYLKKYPESFVFDTNLLAKLKALGFSETLLEILLFHGQLMDALELCLNSKSEKTFELVEKSQERFAEFVRIPDFYQKIFGIDAQRALRICQKNNVELDDIINWLSSDLIIKVLSELPELNLRQEIILLDEIIAYSPEALKDLLVKFTHLTIENILEKLKLSKFDELRISLLQKLGKDEEILQILQQNFNVRVKYLKNFPELWAETLNEAKQSKDLIRKVLPYIHFYEEGLAFIQTLDFQEFNKEIQNFIMNFGQSVKLHKLSVSSAKYEKFLIFKKLFKEHSRGIYFNLGTKCSKCLKVIQEFSCLRLRKCGHHSHKDCLDKCLLCIDPSILH